MREPLTVAVAQPPCVSHDVQANAIAHAAAIRAADAHLVVFPELSMTGYELDAEPLSLDDPLLEDRAARHGGRALQAGSRARRGRGARLAARPRDLQGHRRPIARR